MRGPTPLEEVRQAREEPAHRTVPNHHALVHAFEAVQRARRISDNQLCRKAGIANTAPGSWRSGCMPTLANFDAAMRAMGFRLVLAPLDEDPDAAVIARQVRRP